MAQTMIRAPIGGLASGGGETNSPSSVISMMWLSFFAMRETWSRPGLLQALPEAAYAAGDIGRSMTMKVGLFINTQFPEGYVSPRVPEMVEQVRVARDAGFESLWFPHHWLTYPMQMLQITPVMAISRRTPRA
jgi:hypothetical protein